MVYSFKSCKSSQLLIIPSSSRAAYIHEPYTLVIYQMVLCFCNGKSCQLFLVLALKHLPTFRLRCPTLILCILYDMMKIFPCLKTCSSEYDQFPRNKEGFRLWYLYYKDSAFSIYKLVFSFFYNTLNIKFTKTIYLLNTI